MDPFGHTADDEPDRAGPESCPFHVLADALGAFAALSRAWADPESDPLASMPTIVLRGMPGTEAVGAFALDNLRSRPLRATILTTAFVDDEGEEVPVQLRLAPKRVTLQPGESVVIHVTATVPSDLARNDRLHGGIMVPGLTTSMVEMQLRTA